MKTRSIVLGILLGIFVPLLAEAAEVIHFGCPAYLIGGTPNLTALKQKNVTSIVIDPTSGVSASQAQAQGMQAIYYVNSFCQSDKFRCEGPRMAGSDVSGTYGEVIPQPESQFFYNNFSSQTQRVQQLGGTVIEIDNMDEYVKRGHVNAIKYLIEAAGKAGINVVMKNETNATLLSLSNVVGAIAEPGSHNKGYRAAFTRAGKPTAGVLVINGSASDTYTSVSNVNHTGGSGEYTTFYNCTSNAGGLRSPTPPTDFRITPPLNLLSQQPTQPLLSNLQRSLVPLAQPLLQQPQVPQQTSSVQPQQYFAPTPAATGGTTYPANVNTGSNPSIAQSLLQMLRPESIETPKPTIRILVSSSTGSLSSSRGQSPESGTVVEVQPLRPTTFISNTALPHSEQRTSATESLSRILESVASVLRNVLNFLQGK